jgi:glutathione S-transferase
MQYLVARYDPTFQVSYPPGTRDFYETNNWLFFQNAGVGPMQGQANHFSRYAPEKIEYGINRYVNETRRLYGVLNKHLLDSGKPYLVGDKCTIADIAHWGWIAAGGWAGVNVDEFPELKKWEERMSERPGVQKGQDVPEPNKLKELLKDPKAAAEHAAKNAAWIQQGMKEDAASGK